jgi:hypothetical protein
MLGVSFLPDDLNLLSLGLSFNYCVCYWFSLHKSVIFVLFFCFQFPALDLKENMETCCMCAFTHVYCIPGY